MLLSVPGPNVRTKLRLPSQPKGIVIPADQVPSLIPIKMRRKIFVVNDRLAVGAAGSVPNIRRFINDLNRAFHDRSIFTSAEIKNYLNQYGSSKPGKQIMESIQALVLVEATDWSGSLTIGQTGQGKITSRKFGRVVTIGTGSGSIIKQVKKLDNNYKYGFSQPPDGEADFPEFTTLANNFMLLANEYWKEFTSARNLFEGWGGAYDLIYQDSNKIFQYLDGYTIFIRLFDVAQSDKEIQLKNVLKYERRPELSFIAMMIDGKLDFFAAKDITASDTRKVTINKDEFSMNSNLHISIIAVGKGNRYLAPLIQIEGLDPTKKAKQAVITNFDEKGRLWVGFELEYDEWLTELAMSHYQKHAHLFE